MKLYLSSYKLGNETEYLKNCSLKKIALIPDALNMFPDGERKQKNINEINDTLTELGFDVEVLYLRDYFKNKETLIDKANKYNAFFVMGGNVFVLRQAMLLSGFDSYLNKQKNNDKVLYAGYSAGVCVLAPTIEPLKLVDDETINLYNIPTIYKGLNITDYLIAPHYKSDHPESEQMDKVITYLNKNNIKYKPLKDGEVLLDDTLNI
jgi:dipeptidase E